MEGGMNSCGETEGDALMCDGPSVSISLSHTRYSDTQILMHTHWESHAKPMK